MFHIGESIVSYLLLAGLVLVAKHSGILSGNIVWAIVLLLALVMRDTYALFGSPDLRDPIHVRIDWKKLRTDFRSGAISWLNAALFVNRSAVFPVALVTYLLFLFFRETDTFGWADWCDAIGKFGEYALLGTCLVSGALTVVRESIDQPYRLTFSDANRTRRFVLGSYVLALVSGYVVFSQTASLGWIAFPISLTSGLLIFTIGLTLLEEDD